MTAAVAANLAIALLPVVVTGTKELIAFIETSIAAAKQTGEWTDAMQSAYDEALLATAKDPANQPDKP